MASWPAYSTIRYHNPILIETEWKTLKSDFGNIGEEKRKQKWLYPRRHITVPYYYVTNANARTLYDFYLARKGSFEPFNFFYLTSSSYLGEYVGTGDGESTIWNLPSRLAAGTTVYLGGGTESAITILQEGGADGADKLTFDTAPNDGEYITVSFTGYLKVRSRFREDKLAFEDFRSKLKSAIMQWRGLLNA